MKQQLVTKQKMDDKKNEWAINKKIIELKKEFRKHTHSHIGELYKILSSIVKLRRAINPKYRPRSLEWEEGITLNAMSIRYIFSYQYVLPYGLKKVKQGLITDSAICHMLATNTLLREAKWQRKAIKLYIEGKVKISEFAEFNKDEVKQLLMGKIVIRNDDKYFLAMTKTLRSMKSRMQTRKHLLNKSLYSKQLKHAIMELYAMIEEKKK